MGDLAFFSKPPQNSQMIITEYHKIYTKQFCIKLNYLAYLTLTHKLYRTDFLAFIEQQLYYINESALSMIWRLIDGNMKSCISVLVWGTTRLHFAISIYVTRNLILFSHLSSFSFHSSHIIFRKYSHHDDASFFTPKLMKSIKEPIVPINLHQIDII